tara:strand:- start:139 stop:447 length:309 start_codon:yes stop_codon:yes gene_type:complete
MVRTKRILPFFVLLIGIIGLMMFLRNRRIDEEYDVSQTKEALIEYINETTEPDSVFVMSSVSEMTKDKDLVRKIFEEVDKGVSDEGEPLFDKEKLIELIKKI